MVVREPAPAAERPATGPPLPIPLPPGRDVALPGRGTTFCRVAPATDGEPTLLLLHGWTANADLNWCTAYEPLAQRYGVVTMDHRGHGGGIRTRRRFRLVDCADDAVALLDALGLERVVAVGYSMGGAVAQLLARRHPDRLGGVVLAATASRFSGTAAERANFVGLAGIALASRLAPRTTHRRVVQHLLERRTRGYDEWVMAEMLRNDWRSVMEAGHELGRFDATGWLRELRVPAAVVLTTRDNVVPLQRQLRMLSALPDATAHVVDAGHDACVRRPELFVDRLLDACASVVARSSTGSA